jgi:hypothetical protein
MSRSLRASTGVLAAAAALVAAALAGAWPAGSPARVTHAVDRRLCPFPLEVTVTRTGAEAGIDALRFAFAGPATVELRNASTGRRAVLRDAGSYSVDTTTGTISVRGRRIWSWSTGAQVPFLATDGAVRLEAPALTVTGTAHARVIDPCALVAATPARTRPATTPAPWGLPASALGQIGYAGLTPLLGRVVRHDHVHLDLIVAGRHVTVPAGIGLAEPLDAGPCPPGAGGGDCATGHGFFAQVANSPLHTHSASGLVHIEADRPGTYTLGQLFDEWGVRLDARCVGGYCSGTGGELRVYVDGRRVPGDPRGVALTNREEIAVVFAGPDGSGAVPARYAGGWPGPGCGGSGERSCLP